MLATEVRDPGVGLVTVTRAKVTGDLSLTRIYWTILGDAAERKKTVKALERATGFVRHLLAERLGLRRVPEVKFIYDESVAAQSRIEEILLEIHAADAARTVDAPATDAPGSLPAKPAEAPDESAERRRDDEPK